MSKPLSKISALELDLRKKRVAAFRLNELMSRKYLLRAIKSAESKAFALILDKGLPTGLVTHVVLEPEVENYSVFYRRVLTQPEYRSPYSQVKELDKPQRLNHRITAAFKTDIYYYDLMGFAESCKDPFCDAECPLHLEAEGNVPVVVLKLSTSAGPVDCELRISSTIPDKIDRHLRQKGIIRTESHSGRSYSSTSIVCPTR